MTSTRWRSTPFDDDTIAWKVEFKNDNGAEQKAMIDATSGDIVNE